VISADELAEVFTGVTRALDTLAVELRREGFAIV
jgi:hypothetical protein